MLGLEAEHAARLVHPHDELGLAEGEDVALLPGQVKVLGVEVEDLNRLVQGLADEHGELVVRDVLVGAAVEHLLDRLFVAQGQRQQRGHVLGVGQRHALVALVGHGDGQVALHAVHEVVDVVALVGLGPVNVLRAEHGPGQTLGIEQQLHLALPRLLHLVRLHHGHPGRRVHARRRDEHVVGHVPRLGRAGVRGGLALVLGPVVEHELEGALRRERGGSGRLCGGKAGGAEGRPHRRNTHKKRSTPQSISSFNCAMDRAAAHVEGPQAAQQEAEEEPPVASEEQVVAWLREYRFLAKEPNPSAGEERARESFTPECSRRWTDGRGAAALPDPARPCPPPWMSLCCMFRGACGGGGGQGWAWSISHVQGV